MHLTYLQLESQNKLGKKGAKLEDLHCMISRLTVNAIVIKAAWYCNKDRRIDQQN